MPNKKFEERIESESMAIGCITNDRLVCKDCIYRFDDSIKRGNTTRCGAYLSKPDKVLLGKDCDKYRKEK